MIDRPKLGNTMDCMNILFIAHSFPSEGYPCDGIFNYQRTKSLMNCGHHVKCLLLDSITPKLRYFFPIPRVGKIYAHIKEHLKLPDEYHYHEIHVIRLKRISPPYKYFWGNDHQFIRLFNGRKIRKLILDFAPSLIISSGLNPGAALAKLIKQIVDVPFLAILEGSDILLGHKQYKGADKIIAILNQYADKVIFVSENMKRDAAKHFRINNSTVIRNGYDKDIFQYQPNQRSTDGSFYHIVSVGTLNYLKGHDILLRSLIGIEMPYKLTMIGDGEKEKEYQEFIQSYKLRVKMIPRLSQKELRKHLDACDLFCMPSRSESFGIAAIEAMACGVPVVASNTGGLRENIIDGFNGYLFDTGSSEALRSAILHARKTIWSPGDIAGWASANFGLDRWASEILQLAV
jgi:glycosyltransferase involved in cell wall biosynthesis